MRRHYLIVNPASGGGTGAQSVPFITKTLRDLSVSFDLVQTERPGHATELAQRAAADGYDVVVAVGGDGTVNEVLNGLLADSRGTAPSCALGVLCIGRGNDFAFGMGIPKDLREGCQVLRDGHTRRIDAGRAFGGRFPDGRYFGNGVGIGFDTVVGFEAKKLKRLKGFAGYFVAALKTIFLYFHAPLVRIEMSKETLEHRFLMISIMNGRRMGGGFMMAPEASPDDGQLDLCIADQITRAQVFALLPRFMKGTQNTHPAIRTARTQSLTLTAIDGSLPAHMDGETICEKGDKLRVELDAGRIDVVAPAKAGS